ncbi:MotA/TolQ/ExbB proton channel family protein [Halanaerocella petrolearia]
MKYLLAQGGAIIYPLLVSSLVSLTVIIERSYQFFRISTTLSDSLMEQIKEQIKEGKISQAVQLCEQEEGPTAKILKEGINNYDKETKRVKKRMEEVKLAEFPKLEKYLGVLNFLGKITPSLGLLGTVTGMIKTFHILSLNGAPQQLAGGISEALITTAAGLAISIPTLAAYHYFINKLQQMVTHTEKREVELINYISEVGAEDGL